jgi:hypothetical protein
MSRTGFPYPGGCNLVDPSANRLIISTMRLIIPKRSGQQDHLACSFCRSPIVLDQVFRQLPPLPGFQSFFFSTSCNICLSKLRSATICFNFEFSSSSCRRRRSSTTPQTTEFLLPIVKCRLADPHLPADLRDIHIRFRLLKREHDLSLRKF